MKILIIFFVLLIVFHVVIADECIDRNENWNVQNNITCIDKQFNVCGNITIQNNASLNLLNSNVSINFLTSWILINDRGVLNLTGSSRINHTGLSYNSCALQSQSKFRKFWSFLIDRSW